LPEKATMSSLGGWYTFHSRFWYIFAFPSTIEGETTSRLPHWVRCLLKITKIGKKK
jgi:hypothetical protein